MVNCVLYYFLYVKQHYYTTHYVILIFNNNSNINPDVYYGICTIIFQVPSISLICIAATDFLLLYARNCCVLQKLLDLILSQVIGYYISLLLGNIILKSLLIRWFNPICVIYGLWVSCTCG